MRLLLRFDKEKGAVRAQGKEMWENIEITISEVDSSDLFSQIQLPLKIYSFSHKVVVVVVVAVLRVVVSICYTARANAECRSKLPDSLDRDF